MKVVINKGSYTRTVTLSKLHATSSPSGAQLWLEVKSKFSGAKNPEEWRTEFSCGLSFEAAETLSRSLAIAINNLEFA